jgi:hypothetical protein
MVSKDVLTGLHAPIAYFIGGKSDIAHANAAAEPGGGEDVHGREVRALR